MDYEAIRTIKRILEDCMMRVDASREKQVCEINIFEYYLDNRRSIDGRNYCSSFHFVVPNAITLRCHDHISSNLASYLTLIYISQQEVEQKVKIDYSDGSVSDNCLYKNLRKGLTH